MRPLDDARRKRLLTWSALFCAVPLCLTPLAGRSSFELASEQAAFNARFTAPQLNTTWDDKPVSVARDPFVPEAPQSGVVGLQVTQGASMGFTLPANRGAVGTPLTGAGVAGFTVTAIVSGPGARALIDDGARVRVVGVGDSIAGSRITSIDSAGVRLQNGAVLPLSEDQL